MGFDQKGGVVICVSAGTNGKWDVSEKGFEKPLASFDDKEDAYAYATDLTRTKEGATVLVEDEDGFSALPPQGDGGRSPDENRDGRNSAR
ncbi:MAG: hypothetical protein JWM42_292 [Burkholderia sp.]|nr:hypothetical protein [Burkholderia sp.]